MTKTRITADVLRELPDEEVKKLLTELGPQKAEELQHDWAFWARENQMEPSNNKDPRLLEKGLTKTQWNTWVMLMGRGSGKTRAGSEWVRERIKHGNGIIHCVAPTKGDVRKVMVEGDSGLLNVCWKGDKTHRGAPMGFPNWSPTNNTLTWENGAKAVFFSAEDPERLRGPQCHASWTDELCLVQGTIILTGSGEKPIESVESGDYVLTTLGYKRVVRSWKTGDKETWTIKTKSGKTLQGTAGHPISTPDGWKDLKSLKVGGSIHVLNGPEDAGTRHNTTTLTELAHCYIGRYSKQHTGSSSQKSTSTTSTRTKLTTALRTLPRCLSGITSYLTNLVGGAPWIGLRTQSEGGRTRSQRMSSVQNVAQRTSPSANAPSYAATSVGSDTIVELRRNVGVVAVYNIEVEDAHEYFANGILTHNCSWNNAQETWDMMQFGLRLGQHPQTLVTTTPKTTKLIRNILADDKTIISRGSTYDNAANLADTFLEAVRKQYEGTRLGRQELYAEILDEASGALWSRSLLASCEIGRDQVPDLRRIVVSVDPAITSNAESDMTGIVVAGVDINGTAYVLEDATGKYTPQQWASKAVELFEAYEADRVVAEKNQGGDMVKHTLHTECPTLPIKLVHASRGKMARAEPVSALYEQGGVKHVKGLNDLEDQMVQWEPLGSIGSPDRLDALVWAITDLSLKGWAKPAMQLAYSSAVGLLRG